MTLNSPRSFYAHNKQISCLILPTTLLPICLLPLNVVLASVRQQFRFPALLKIKYVSSCNSFSERGLKHITMQGQHHRISLYAQPTLTARKASF